MNSIAILEAVNTSYVPFNGQQIITAMAAGVAYVAMKPIVENLGMSWSTQQTKLMKQISKFNCVHMNMVAADGKLRKLLCLPLKKLNGWLFSINPEKVRADIRDKLIQYQEECFTVLHDYWTKGKAENARKKTSVDDRTPLRDAVNMLVSKKHLMYPEAYAMIHQRFNVESIEELDASQIPQAVEYIHRVVLEGEFIGKQEKKANELSAKEANSLVWLWDYANRSQALFRELYPALKQIQSNYSGRCYDYGHEFSYVIGMARDVLINHTRDVDINEPDGPTNLSAWMRLKNKELPPSVHNY
ncbi:phage antirepressor Ant [Salmonella enterica subsp. enterica]|jgi:phage anti-repressor protein|uniref:phage antirepressor N-terminal domain-containing protein n=1 Tax=Enterobacteriaceae TaxID=543 RepID=UPI000BA951E5|nr:MULTISPECIES: phage antirepressor N-terminal domain-containing protein [Enterobacteriaceae]EAS2640639.1 phage antirepressor Ant [Salmonella enterica]EBU6720218.1 phage antirepressor Ant [Salmonella enterica subsp. enterica serovar Hadar]EBV6515597.1 phage antirepressor Ant [Salmonella enterica subsp. enterica serovar Emek]ECT7523626.1 phage antirepressor Ant [Salmonella enterica subsp. enterica serovar Anatum]EDD5215916.1 phage antirepressor Ant [Salmonella enterica subsp. enterica serovar 